MSEKLETLKLKKQNLELGAEIVRLEVEAVELKKRIFELEAQAFLAQRGQMKSAIATELEAVSSELAELEE